MAAKYDVDVAVLGAADVMLMWQDPAGVSGKVRSDGLVGHVSVALALWMPQVVVVAAGIVSHIVQQLG